MRQFAILGGGMTGLMSAFLLARGGHQVTLVEAAGELGGLARTFPTKGDPLELYYHHFFTHDAEILWLIKELGLDDKLMFRNTTMGVYRNGKIYGFSTASDLLSFGAMGLAAKLRFALTSYYIANRKSWRAFEAIPALSWLYSYAGREATDALWRPMLEIKFGAYASRVPLAWLVGRLSQRMSSRKSGKEQLGYLLGSLQQLVDRLESRLTALNVRIIKGRRAARLIAVENRVRGVLLDPQETLECTDVIATLPSPAIASLVPEEHSGLRTSLNAVEYFGAICVVLRMKRPLSETYWLNVADPGFPFGGVIEHTNFIPKQRYGGESIAYLSRYFAQDDPLTTQNEREILDSWLPKVSQIYPGFSMDQLVECKLFRTRTAATVVDTTFSERVHHFRSSLEGLYVLNMAHIYPDERSINNCVRIAATAADALGVPHSVPTGRSLAGQLGFEMPDALPVDRLAGSAGVSPAI